MSVTVSVTLTDEEYQNAMNKAMEIGLTISQYVKRYPIGASEFEDRFEFLKEQASTFPVNKPFTVMSLFPDWNSIERGIKLSLYRNFFHIIKRGELPTVTPYGKNSSNVQLYVVYANYFLYLNNDYNINELNYENSEFEVDKKSKKLYQDIISFWNIQCKKYDVINVFEEVFKDEYESFYIQQENKNIKLKCDYLGPSTYYAKDKGISDKEIIEYLIVSRELGGHMLWPSTLINISRFNDKRDHIQKSINTGRSYCFRERIDYTLFDIKNWYYGEYEKMHKYFKEILDGNRNWFNQFGDGEEGYKNFINFFVLFDFVDKSYNPYHLSSFDNKNQKYNTIVSEHPHYTEYIPSDKDEYQNYIKGCLYAIKNRTKNMYEFL